MKGRLPGQGGMGQDAEPQARRFGALARAEGEP
jgi:hypothetical protein